MSARLTTAVLGIGVMLFSLAAHASCGSASCSLATHIDGLGLTTNNGWQMDLRYEYIKQHQLRSGTQKTDPAFVDGEHTEMYTTNKNLVATLDYSSANRWGISLQLPYVQREHYHIFDNAGSLEDETWKFGTLADARVIGRYMLAADSANNTQAGVQLGVKLPTGKTDEANAAGEVAERSLQPGTGTTDVIVGYFRSRDLTLFDIAGRGFLQLQAQAALRQHDGYRTGHQYRLNTGMVFHPTAGLSPILQINVLRKPRDKGSKGNPADSGAEYFWFSPGLSRQIGHSARLYGFVQLPLYQRVNGTQLTANWTTSIGINWQL